eukprot:PITA_27913
MSLLGELTYFLGLQVQQNKGDIFLSQTKYLKQILKKYGMEDSKPICTPMVTGCSLSANDESAAVHQPTYRSMIGSLLYLTDLAYSQGEFGQHTKTRTQGEHNPLPLMSKGENEFEYWKVAIKSKGGDCWHYDTSLALWHNVTRNSVHSDVAIPTKMGGYLRNKQVKSTFIFLYENREEGDQGDQL